jgi:hypothetical protein
MLVTIPGEIIYPDGINSLQHGIYKTMRLCNSTRLVLSKPHFTYTEPL